MCGGLGDSVSIEKTNIHMRLMSDTKSLANKEESIYRRELRTQNLVAAYVPSLTSCNRTESFRREALTVDLRHIYREILAIH